MTLRPKTPIFSSESRARRIGVLLIAMWVLGSADLFFTIWAQVFTQFRELNPIARHLLGRHQLLLLVGFKIGLTAIASFIFWRFRSHRIAELGIWLVIAAYVALALRWSEYTQQVLVPQGDSISAVQLTVAEPCASGLFAEYA